MARREETCLMTTSVLPAPVPRSLYRRTAVYSAVDTPIRGGIQITALSATVRAQAVHRVDARREDTGRAIARGAHYVSEQHR
jgi:hypothetical protein